MTISDLATITVEGVDGSVWRVSGAGAGREGVTLGPSPSGLYDVPVRTIWQYTARKPGASFGGVRWEPTDLVLMFMIIGEGRTWESVEAGWRRAWSYEADSTFVVQTPESGARRLKLRMFETPTMTPEYDPRRDGYSELVMSLRAGDPFYAGDPRVQTITADTASGEARILLDNLGDRELWPVWEKTGRGRWTIPDRQDSSSDRRIIMPNALSPLDYVVNSDPHSEQVVAAGYANAWASMGVFRFTAPLRHAVEPFEAPVTWTGAAPGSTLSLLLRDRWSRPWS